MSVNLENVSHKYMHLNLLHRYSSQLCSKGFGVHRGQPPILDYLCVHGECSQKEIADFLGVSPASVAVSIKRLQKSGFVEKTPDENDLRFNKIRLTSLGEDTSRKAKAAFSERDRQMFNGFSEKDIENFDGYLDRMIKNLTPDKDISIHEILNLICKEDDDA